jgi:hypothetical protein
VSFESLEKFRFYRIQTFLLQQSFKSLTIINDDESNEGILVVDSSPTPSRASSSDLQSPIKRGTGRGRGRPRGSRARGTLSSRGRGSVATSAALAAAELAGAQAGKSAALAAYPFLGSALNTTNDINSESVVSTIPKRRGRGRGRSKVGLNLNHGNRIPSITANTRTTHSTQAFNSPNHRDSQTTQQITSSHGLGFYVQK